MKRPMLGLSISFTGGIILGWWVEPSFWMSAIAAAICLCAFVLSRRTQFGSWVLWVAVAASGVAAYSFAVATPSPHHIKNIFANGKSQNIEVRGLIVSDPHERGFTPESTPYAVSPRLQTASDETDSESSTRADFILAVQSIKRLDTWEPAEGRMLAYVNMAGRTEKYQYGQVVRCQGMIESPEAPRNPGQFDFRTYLAARKIFFLLKIRQDDSCHIEQLDRGHWWIALALQLRDRMNDTLHQGLLVEANPPAQNRDVAALISAMLLGYREEIPSDIKESFTRTSAMHIFAISGLHVGMVATVIFFGLRLFHLTRRWCATLTIPVLFFYVLATGFRSSAIRAFVMTAVFIGCWVFVRPADALNSLGAAALSILAFDPPQLFDGGFQMSFAVVASIILCMPRFEKIFIRPFQPDAFLSRELVPRWRQSLFGLGRGVATWFSITLSASIGSLPFIAYYFHIFSPISIVSNMIVVLLAFFMVATGAMAIVTSLVSSWLAVTFNNANLAFGVAMIHTVNWLSDVPGGFRYVESPPAWGIVLYYAIVIALVSGWIFRDKWRRLLGATVAILLAIGFAAVWFAQRNVTRLTFLDVGAGGSVFVDTSGERHDALIDAGRESAGRYIVEPFLRSRGVDSLHSIFMSQGDVAHAGGLHWVLCEIRVGEIIESGWHSPGSRTQRQVLDLIYAKGIPLRQMCAGARFSLAPGTEIRVLNPPRQTEFKTMDDNSLVLQICVGEHRILLMSDAGETVENLLLESGADLKSDVVCFGQHRQEPNCTVAFLARVDPKVVILTRGGTWGGKAPVAELMERLAQRNVQVFDTARHGAVTLELSGKNLKIKSVLSPR